MGGAGRGRLAHREGVNTSERLRNVVAERLASVAAAGSPLGRSGRYADPAAETEAEPPAEVRARPRFDRRHLAVIAILMALLGSVTWIWLGQVSETRVPIVAETPQSPTPTAEPTPSRAAGFYVHVVGAVARPGIVELPAGARVQAAIEAAGGLTDDADPALLNLAAPVADGTQIVVGTKEAPLGEVRDGPVQKGAKTGSKVNLNTATASELETLPGVGPATSKAIIARREAKGPFTRAEELKEVEGIGPKTYAKLSALIGV